MRIAHLSRIRGAADGGISLIVEEMSAAQRQAPAVGAAAAVRWLAAPDDLRSELRRFAPDLVHVHGLWSAPNRLIARRPGLPTVVAPQGMLDPWALAQRRWRKRAAWRIFERGNLQRAGAVQAVTAAEREAIRAQGIRTPVAIIPNAVSLPDLDAALPAPPSLPWSPGTGRVLLFLSRFHEKKGLDPLLAAWQLVQAEAAREQWHLALVGYGDHGALARRVAAAQARGELARVTVLGPCFGAEKAAVLAAASAFVLPSFSEGLPMAALEAMAHRLPCLLSAACNLPEAFSAGAALSAPPDPAALASALRQLFALSPAERAAMGAAGRDLVAARYSWPRVAQQTLELYRWILGGGERPGFVEVG
ncbi:glycosyltransferase [Cyanobium sp. ATX 6A2]|uniref:glycosyltransferase n=1 Tax=Cyanobium sp. ATX 6A2 TaxID=2823700 RepID=UPI0020CF5403|nr:glycosyltransferase [Cyanobium sp. ATX 6A2]MCP9888704.1 glycosyltransferase [Cyanobium sp. ATX 6A2]